MHMAGVMRMGLIRMMPVLRAEEELREVSLIAAGTGSLKKDDARAWLKARQREVRGGRKPQAERAASWSEHFDQLRKRGFNVVIDGPGGGS